MSLKLLDEVYKDKLHKNVVSDVFPNLNNNHKQLLHKHLIKIINVIMLCNDIVKDKYTAFLFQLSQNNYRDAKWLLLLLLPYINTDSNTKLITSLNDIYTKKTEDVDINKTSPKYVYSNLQYDRCVYDEKTKEFSEIVFREQFVEDTSKLLCDAIYTSANKYFVNWINIMPYTLNDYKDTPLYKYTMAKYNSNMFEHIDGHDLYKDTEYDNDADKLQKLYTNNRGLGMHDIYNTVRNELYENIVRLNWLIVDIPISYNGKQALIPLINILSGIINLESCVANEKWEDLQKILRNKDDNKNKNIYVFENASILFKEQWKSILFAASSHMAIKCNINTINGLQSIFLPPDSLYMCLMHMIINFELKYMSYIDEAQFEGYKRTEKTVDELLNNITAYNSISEQIRTIPIHYLYDFLTNELQKFKNTWYGTNLMSDNKKTFLFRPIPSNYVPPEKLAMVPTTHMNIFGFARVLCSRKKLKSDTTKIWPTDKLWNNLTHDEKNDFIKHINEIPKKNIEKNTNNIANVLINKYLQSTHKIYEGILYKGIGVYKLYYAIHEQLIPIVFNSMITRGILSYYISNSITDEKMTNQSSVKTMLKQTVFNTKKKNNMYESAYHFLSQLPYSAMKIDNPETESFDVFDNNCEIDWYLSTGINWVAQIGFVLHFMNNRVTFITGGTGIGKSTQIPKLYLYFLKAIDNINDGTVACTEPRIMPTKNNAKRVALELGVPIELKNIKTKNNNKCDNYYVQIETGDSGPDGSHKARDTIKTASLTYITDGKLIANITNPLLKRIKNKLFNGDSYEEFSDSNIYDVIIIDESHEHGKNIDLLLTRLKNILQLNNSIKLVIASATMDADEPIYRRYYRQINDNKKYPLSTYINDYNINRINIDRRYHIAYLGMTTKFPITEFYEPYEPEKHIIGICNIVKKIMQTSTDGDILVFQPGEALIAETITELNKMRDLPPNVIAIPYYANLNPDKKEFVEKISENKFKLRISRTTSFNDCKSLEAGVSNYSRVIIVATRIAEASITIDTLRFVIDTGTSKIAEYIYKTFNTRLITISINEASRLQRKGRVGRVAPGTVYYMYEKDDKVQNAYNFDFSNTDVTYDIYKLLKSTPNEPEFLSFDPNDNITDDHFKKQNVMSTTNNINEIIEQMYCLNGTYYEYTGYADTSLYTFFDYTKYGYNIPNYKSGYNITNIYDSNGLFYLVHPDENYLARNIGGHIINVAEDADITMINNTSSCINKYNIYSKKMHSMLTLLLHNIYLGINDDHDVFKTEFGMCVIKLSELLKDSVNMVRMLLIGYALEIPYVKQLFYINSSKVLNNKIINLFEPDSKGLFDIALFKTMFNKPTETHYLVEIIKIIDNFLKQNKININYNDDMYYEDAKKTTDNAFVFNSQTNLNQNAKIEQTKAIDKELFNVFAKKYDSDYKKTINEFCEKYKLNSVMVHKYIINYHEFDKMVTTELAKPEYSTVINNIKHAFQQYIIYGNFDPYTLIYTLSFPFNICKKVPDTNLYISLYKSNLQKINETDINSKLFIDDMHKWDLILYTNIDVREDMINVVYNIHHIDYKYLYLLNNIYNIDFMRLIKTNEIKNYRHSFDKYILSNDAPPESLYGSNTVASLVKLNKEIKDVFYTLKTKTHVNNIMWIKQLDQHTLLYIYGIMDKIFIKSD